jgi:threonine/homoserine/homoserine lactone efflux protein
VAAGRSGREFIAPLPVIDPQFAAYLVFTTLLVVTPGSATAVVVRNVLDGGRRQGMAAAVGAAIGNTTYAVLSALGLAALFARSPLAFLVLRIVGTCYLAFLGVRSLWLAWRPRPAALPGALESAGAHGAGQAVRIGMTQGAANNLVSPAIATFYLAVVPSFLAGSTTGSRRYALFAAIHVTMAFAYHSTWVLALHAMRAFWSRPHARRALETLAGVALLLLAARVAGAL